MIRRIIDEVKLDPVSNEQDMLARLADNANKALKNNKDIYSITYAVRHRKELKIPSSISQRDPGLFIAYSDSEYRHKVKEYCNGQPQSEFQFYTVYSRK